MELNAASPRRASEEFPDAFCDRGKFEIGTEKRTVSDPAQVDLNLDPFCGSPYFMLETVSPVR
jgi:hypothetical protein